MSKAAHGLRNRPASLSGGREKDPTEPGQRRWNKKLTAEPAEAVENDQTKSLNPLFLSGASDLCGSSFYFRSL
jgi:hypothetical protein